MGTHRPGIPRPGWSRASSWGRAQSPLLASALGRAQMEDWEALAPWPRAPPRYRGGERRRGWGQSRGNEVQRCLVCVLQNSRSWAGSEGVPLLVAENSNSDNPACLSGLVADSAQTAQRFIRRLRDTKGKKKSSICSPIRRQFGPVFQKPATCM